MNFVYLTTNLINGKQYIGDHSSEQIIDNYLGSGILIIKAVKNMEKKTLKEKYLNSLILKKKRLMPKKNI